MVSYYEPLHTIACFRHKTPVAMIRSEGKDKLGFKTISWLCLKCYQAIPGSEELDKKIDRLNKVLDEKNATKP